MFVSFKSSFNMHGSLEDHFLVIRIPWLNKVIITLSKAIFTRDQFASIKNVSSHASEATTSAIGRESVRTPQWFLAMNNALILLHEIFSLKC